MITQNKLHRALKSAVITAGICARGEQRTITAEVKGAKDTVTRVDRENGAGIKEFLLKVDPTLSFLDEEQGASGSGRILVVTDPIDATTNFILGRREFSIMGAILEDGIPQYAVIDVPATGETFEAVKGEGAFLNNIKISVRIPGSLAEAVISCNRSNYPSDASLEFGLRIIRLLAKQARSWRNLGTAGCEYSDVACGKLDGIITPIAEAVHIAGYLIMEEAGARVTDGLGVIATLDSKEIVASHPAIHDALLRIAQDSK